MKKRLFALFLMMIMLLTILPAGALAEGEQGDIDGLASFRDRRFSAPEGIAEPETEPGTVLFFDPETDPIGEDAPEPEGVEKAEKKIYFNETNFPDKTFRNLLKKAFDRSYMTQSEAESVRSINVSGMGIGSLKGVEFFTKMRYLYCGANYDSNGNVTAKNKLTALDISKNTNLEKLFCDNNQLKSLNLSKNTELDTLACDYNRLTTLDVSKMYLRELSCTNNGMTKLITPNDMCFVTLFDCSDNKLTTLDVSEISISSLYCDNNLLTFLDLSDQVENDRLVVSCSGNPIHTIEFGRYGVAYLNCENTQLTSLEVPDPEALRAIYCSDCRIDHIDLSGAARLEELACGGNRLKTLDVSDCAALYALDCTANELETLDVSANTALSWLGCASNRLCKLDLAQNTELTYLYCLAQTRYVGQLTETGEVFTYDIHALDVDPARVVPVTDEPYVYDAEAGVFTFAETPPAFTYCYDTGADAQMDVTLFTPYTGEAAIVWTDPAIAYRGETPYVIYSQSAQAPRFDVVNGDGETLDPAVYTYEFANNVDPGTAALDVRFRGSESACSAWFKIYMPATTSTSVENTQDGIQIGWASVKDAKGYVIYRRAWSTTTDGWTEFKRWNNTTETTWTDTTVYAGTRYQYGVKAYFEDPMDNFNLGMVGPLKTTVRITTRVLNSVTPGSKRLTAKWAASGLFTGYQVQIATNSAFSQNVKTVGIAKPKTTQTVIKSLTSGRTYWVRVRSYHVFNGTTYYGGWSNVLSCKVK